MKNMANAIARKNTMDIIVELVLAYVVGCGVGYVVEDKITELWDDGHKIRAVLVYIAGVLTSVTVADYMINMPLINDANERIRLIANHIKTKNSKKDLKAIKRASQILEQYMREA